MIFFYVISTSHVENRLEATTSRVFLLPYLLDIIIVTVTNVYIKVIEFCFRISYHIAWTVHSKIPIFHTLVCPPHNITLFMLFFCVFKCQAHIFPWDDVTFFWDIWNFWEANLISGMYTMCIPTSDATVK